VELVVAAGICVLLGQAWTRWAGVVLAAMSGIGSLTRTQDAP